MFKMADSQCPIHGPVLHGGPCFRCVLAEAELEVRRLASKNAEAAKRYVHRRLDWADGADLPDFRSQEQRDQGVELEWRARVASR